MSLQQKRRTILGLRSKHSTLKTLSVLNIDTDALEEKELLLSILMLLRGILETAKSW